jgi:SAM-dependent methyltransferase
MSQRTISPAKARPADGAPGGHSAEEARIRSAYAKRAPALDPRYSWLDPGYLFEMQERQRHTLHFLRENADPPLQEKRILDLGCGTGGWVRQLVLWGANPELVTGVDLLPERVDAAKRLSAPGVDFRCGSGTDIDAPDAHFDLVMQSVVFSSVLDPFMREEMAREMVRVLSPRGIILWYDFRVDNPRNPDVRGVPMREIRRLFPGCHLDLRRTTLAPPIARRLAPHSWALCSMLNRVAPLRTHYLGVIRKRG